MLLGDDVAAKVAADEEFHSIVLEASRNKGLTAFYETFIPSLREYRSRVCAPPADPLLAWRWASWCCSMRADFVGELDGLLG